MMDSNIIVYKSFYNPIEANIVRAKLEDSGIHCFLTDENISILQPLYNQAIGGVKLHVFEQDKPEIDLLLAKEHGQVIYEELSPDKTAGESITICAKCGSTNVAYGQATKNRYSWWVAIVALMLAVYPFKVNMCFHCYDCGNEFL